MADIFVNGVEQISVPTGGSPDVTAILAEVANIDGDAMRGTDSAALDSTVSKAAGTKGTDNVFDEVAGLNGVAMRGTDSAATASALTTHATALATHDTALGTHDTALGTHNTALGTHDTALGTHDTALGTHNTALGTHDTALGTHDTALGTHNTALGTHDTALGTHDTALGTHDTALTNHNTALTNHDSAIDTQLVRVQSSRDFWSVPAPVADTTLSTTQATQAITPTVVVPSGTHGIPSGATIDCVHILAKWRQTEDTSGGDNAIDNTAAAMQIQIDDLAGTGMFTAYDFADNSYLVEGATYSIGAGDMIEGITDIKTRVDAADTYDIQLLNAECDADNLIFRDFTWGLRIWWH